MTNIFLHGDRNKNEIAITFDDGPSEETEKILEVLKKYNIKATFFIVGKMIKGRENIIEKIKIDGHEFGNHTYSHKRLWFKSKNFIEKDIEMCDAELDKFKIKTALFRFPGLKFGFNSLVICKKLNKKIIFGDALSFDWVSYDWFNPWLKKKKFIKGLIKINKVIEKTILKTKGGSIVVFHDYLQEIGPHKEITEILENILPVLKNKNLKFVTVSELLEFNK
jgi:peptidoglycan/xylan/chitin deacetylase (PgdA/CDA1 family)